MGVTGGTTPTQDGHTARLHLRLLGVPCCLAPGGREHPLAARDALLLLLLASEGPFARSRAAALLWPDSAPRQAGISLRQRIFRLKRALGAELISGDAALRLADGVQHDLHDLEVGLRGDPGHATGELLAGVNPADADDELATWLQATRQHWHEGRHRLLAALAEEHASAGRIAVALPYAERLVAEAPAIEHAHRRLMRLHYQRGDRAAALAAYRHCELRLRQELDAAPGAETRALAALLWDEAAPPASPRLAPPPLTLLRPPHLAGRDAALQAIAAAWQAGHPVLLSGEPGIGKSRLLAEQAARWQCGAALLIECRPGDAQQPYAVAARLVQGWWQRCGRPADAAAAREWARFVPGLGAPAPGATATARLHEALTAWAAHAAAAGHDAVLVDDLQFADAASLDALLALLGPATPLHWLLAVRAAERPPALQAWLATPAADATEELPLAALDAQAVAELLRSLALPGLDVAGWAGALWRHAGGNPFYTLQTLLACADAVQRQPPAMLPVPRHLSQLMQRRLRQLGTRALQLAQIAALAQADFSVPLAARVLQCHALELAPAWAELEAAQVLRAEGFAHDLVREAVAGSVPAPIAHELHRQIADALEGRGVPPARLAWHLEQGGQAERAAATYAAAAEQALAAGLRREEAAALDAALRCLPRGAERSVRFRLLERRCRAARYVDPYAKQLRLADELEALADGALERADAMLDRATVLVEGQQWAGGLAAVEQALQGLPAGDAQRQRRAATLHARCLMGLGDVDTAIHTLQAEVADALRTDDAESARYLLDLAVLLGKADRPREARPLLQRARAVAEALPDWGLAAEIHVYLGWLLTNQARTRRSIPYYERARVLHLRTGAPISLPVGSFVGLARQYREVGRYAEALELLETIVAAQGGAGEFPMRTVGLMDLAILFLELGRPERALQLLGPGLSPPADAYAPSWLMARARIETFADRPAADLLRAAFDLVRGDSQRLLRWVVARELALALPPEAGAALARAEADSCAAADCPYALWGLRLALCDRLLVLACGAEAAALARDFLARFAGGVPPGLYAPRAWLIVRDALVAAGDTAATAAAHRQGHQWVHLWARPRVPAPFAESFLRRNPFNPPFASAAGPGPRPRGFPLE